MISDGSVRQSSRSYRPILIICIFVAFQRAVVNCWSNGAGVHYIMGNGCDVVQGIVFNLRNDDAWNAEVRTTNTGVVARDVAQSSWYVGISLCCKFGLEAEDWQSM